MVLIRRCRLLRARGPGQLRSLQRAHLAISPLSTLTGIPKSAANGVPSEAFSLLSQLCSQLLLTTSSITQKKCPLQNVNRKWKMNESGWNRLQPTLTHKSDRKAALDCCNTKLALCLCLLHGQTKQQYAYLSVYSSSCVQLLDFLHWHY